MAVVVIANGLLRAGLDLLEQKRNTCAPIAGATMFEPATDPRQNLKALAAAEGRSLTFLSALLGRDPAYLQQFCESGSSVRLNPDDTLLLAKYFGVDESLLGARRAWSPGM